MVKMEVIVLIELKKRGLKVCVFINMMKLGWGFLYKMSIIWGWVWRIVISCKLVIKDNVKVNWWEKLRNWLK